MGVPFISHLSFASSFAPFAYVYMHTHTSLEPNANLTDASVSTDSL